MAIPLTTPDRLEYKFYPASSKRLQFRVKANNDAHIALTTGPSESEPMFEIFIGGWGNTKTVIRKNRNKPEVAEQETPGILDGNDMRGFRISWEDNKVEVAKEGEAPFLTAFDNDLGQLNYFGFCTGWGASGEWCIEEICVSGHNNFGQPSAPAQLLSGGPVCNWVPFSGDSVPPGATVGGKDLDDEPLLVGRASHGGSMIPGKIKMSHGTCYVPWGGEEHAKREFEVLCYTNSNWVPTVGGNIPSNALPSGEDENGEPLFVGRVNHEGGLIVGKVHPSHGVCYIAHGGAELPFEEYEILV